MPFRDRAEKNYHSVSIGAKPASLLSEHILFSSSHRRRVVQGTHSPRQQRPSHGFGTSRIGLDVFRLLDVTAHRPRHAWNPAAHRPCTRDFNQELPASPRLRPNSP